MVQQKYFINKKKGGIKEQSLDKIKRKVSLNIISSYIKYKWTKHSS